MYYTEDSNIPGPSAQILSRTRVYITNFEYKQDKNIFSNKIQELFGIQTAVKTAVKTFTTTHPLSLLS